MFLRRTATVTALAGLGLSGAGIAAAATPTHTSLSIRSVKAAIDAGGHDTIAGVLLAAGHPLAGAAVVLRAKPAGASSFHDVATHTSGNKGAVAFLVSPAHTTAYELVFRGDGREPRRGGGVVPRRAPPAPRHSTSLSIRI